MEIRSYKDLHVWQKSMALAREIYTVTKSFPTDERFGITSQMRRSSVSIPSNIAEGRRRGSRKDYLRFVRIAYGSAAELETQVILAHDFGYLQDEKQLETVSHLLEDVLKMLNKLISSLQNRLPTSDFRTPNL